MGFSLSGEMLNYVHLTLFSCTEETFKHLQGHKKKSNNYTQPKHFPAGVKHSSFVSINGLKPMMKRSFAPPIVPAPFSRLLIKFHRTCRSHSHVFWHSRKKKAKPILSSGSVVKGFRNPNFRIGSAIYYSLQHVGPSVICKKKGCIYLWDDLKAASSDCSVPVCWTALATRAHSEI